jgi:hypothetical protein
VANQVRERAAPQTRSTPFCGSRDARFACLRHQGHPHPVSCYSTESGIALRLDASSPTVSLYHHMDRSRSDTHTMILESLELESCTDPFLPEYAARGCTESTGE